MNTTKEFLFRKLPISYLQALAKFRWPLKSRYLDIKALLSCPIQKLSWPAMLNFDFSLLHTVYKNIRLKFLLNN